MMRAFLPVLLLVFAASAYAQQCQVADPELQQSYTGPCLNGLAEGFGIAIGPAEYRGEFRSGRKHGKGVKTWQNGDRYEGDFFEDRIEGFGAYVFGRGPWVGESYQGDYVAGRRHGHGVYRWATGDIYSGPWRDDIPTGSPTPMMAAQHRFFQESRLAVAKQGQKVCRQLPVGIGGRDWVRGVVVAVADDKIAVRIDDLGSQSNALAAIAKAGEAIWDVPHGWTPCY